MPHPEVGEALVLYIVPDKGAEDIIDRVRRSLSINWTCESIQIVSEIPKTANGKISRASLPATVIETYE
jgi:acyl-CoA synthetase (AMP-forming)/AMP-acid ligase II